MRYLPAMALLLAACGRGNDTPPQLVFNPPALTVSSTGTQTAELTVVPGTLAMPRGIWHACVFGGGGQGAAVAATFCVDFSACEAGCSATVAFQGAVAADPSATPVAGASSFYATGPLPFPQSDPIAVTQTVP
jgi:hypothetical protein